MRSLIDDMKYWRAERPDEWKMDEFIREVEALQAELKQKDEEIARLRVALRGGNATNDNPELLRFIADRLVHVYKEPQSIDFVNALRERASIIERALKESE